MSAWRYGGELYSPRQAFSLDGDLLLLSNGIVRYDYGAFPPTYAVIESDCVLNSSLLEYSNPTFRGDSICVNTTVGTMCLSLSTMATSCKLFARTRYNPSCAGHRGSLEVSPRKIENPFRDDIITDSFTVRYIFNQSGDTLSYVVKETGIHSVGANVGYWNGAFYFTAEVRDSGAPIETATTIIYKYTEPVPAVSVEDHRPEPTTREITEHLALSQEAYATWLAGLGPDVSVFDLLGKDTCSAPPRPGVFCVTSAGRRWIVLCY